MPNRQSESLLRRMRWKAHYFDKGNNKDNADTSTGGGKCVDTNTGTISV